MPTGFNPPLLFLRALDHEGLPAPGAKLYHRVAGTELPKAIYYDAALTSECPQPLVADAEGRFPQFFLEGGAYRFVLFDQSDVQLRPPEDPIWGANGGSIFPTPTNSGFLYYDEDTDTYSWIQVEGSKVKVDADDPVAGYLSEKLTDSDTVHWEVLPDHSGIQAVVQEGAGDTYKTKVNADDTAPGFLEQKLADTTDTQFSPTEDGSQLDNIVYQLTGLGTRLNRVKDAGFDFDRGPFPAGNYAGGRGISFGRRYVAGVEVDTWIAQGNNGKLYWTSNNDATRWKITTEDDSVYSAYPGGRTYYGWSCIQFVYVAGAHNCFCWVMGSGDLAQTVVFIEHKPENYNADGTFKTAALNSVTYGPLLGPYSAIDIMQVDTTGGIFIAGDDTRVGYTTDLATFQVVLTADHNVGGLGFDGETTVQVVERDSGVIWKSENYGNPGTFSKVLSFYLDDVLVSHFPTDFSAQWGSMFSMYGQWLSINFHYVSGGIGFIYSDDGIYWYSSKDEATPFYDANNDGLRWFATNAVPNSGTPIYQLIVSMIPVHRRLSIEKGAVVSGPLILRELTNVPILGTDHRGRIVNGTGSLSGYFVDLTTNQTVEGVKTFSDGIGALFVDYDTTHDPFTFTPGRTYWDTDAQTLATDLGNGTTLQHGQESQIFGRNNTGATLANGKAVYCSGTTGFRPTFALAENDDPNHWRAIAFMTQDLAINSQGYATTFGMLNDVDTSAVNENDELYLSATPGEFQNTRPAAPTRVVRLGRCIRKHPTEGKVFVNIFTFPYLSELSDVEVSSPTAGQVLKHDGTKWVNGTPATGATEYDAVCSSEAELVAALTSATVQSIYIRIPSGGEYTLGSATTSLVVGATKRIYGEAVFLGGIAINPNGFTMRWRNQKVDVTGAASFAAGGSVYIKNVNIQGGTLNGTSGTRQYEQCNTAASVSNFVQRFWDVVFPSSASIGDASILRWNSATGLWDPVSLGVTAPFGQELFSYSVSETTGAIGSDGNLGTVINATTRAFAFVPAGTVTITKMRTMITQTGGTYFRLGLYDASGNLVAKSARYSVSNGMKEVALTLGPSDVAISGVTLTGGMVYYMAYWTDDTTQNFHTPVLSGRSTSTASPLMQRTSGSNSEMPNTIGSATNTGYRPWLMISG